MLALNSATVATRPRGVDPEPSGELVDGVSRLDRDARHVVLLGAQQRPGGGIEELEGDAARLLEHGAAVAGVGVVAEVGALVDEALARRR